VFCKLILSHLDLTVINCLGDFLWAFSVDSTSKRNACSQDFFAGSIKVYGHWFFSFSHCFSNFKDIVEFKVSIILHGLSLLSISTCFLQCLDDKGSWWRNDSDCAISVQDLDLNLNFDSFPLGSSLLNIFSYFFWRKTEWTTLWSESCSTCYLTTNNFHVHWKKNILEFTGLKQYFIIFILVYLRNY